MFDTYGEHYLVSHLPSWIKDSEFVRQYEEDYPGELLKLDNNERLFELPPQFCGDSALRVMENVRYFGISNDSLVVKQLFEFYINGSNQLSIQSHKASFPELKVLWDNVEFTIQSDDIKNKAFAEGAASGNFLMALRYAHENGCSWDTMTCSLAVFKGNLDCLKYAHENGCAWNEQTCYWAAGEGHLDCLKYAYENGCAWDEYTCSQAAEGGHLDCLKYAHENGCSWVEETCSGAASGGHLDCLKYAHENACSWDEVTCSGAASGGHLDCLKYANENGIHHGIKGNGIHNIFQFPDSILLLLYIILCYLLNTWSMNIE